MRFVVDASVAVKWVVNEPDTDIARNVLIHSLVVPDFIYTECANVLWKKWRDNKLGDVSIKEVMLALLSLEMESVSTLKLLESANEIAQDLLHPVYDCIYLALAEEYSVTLITADEKFLRKVQHHAGYGSLAAHMNEVD